MVMPGAPGQSHAWWAGADSSGGPGSLGAFMVIVATYRKQRSLHAVVRVLLIARNILST